MLPLGSRFIQLPAHRLEPRLLLSADLTHAAPIGKARVDLEGRGELAKVGADGKVYCLNETGACTVLDAKADAWADAVLATNTSSIPIEDIARVTRIPDHSLRRLEAGFAAEFGIPGRVELDLLEEPLGVVRQENLLAGPDHDGARRALRPRRAGARMTNV